MESVERISTDVEEEQNRTPRSVLSQVPKCEAPGAPRFSGCDHFSRHLGHPPSRIEEASELWELERWLTRRRQQIDREFDFRYSVLPHVFARLLRERRLIDNDLQGLSRDKLDLIRQLAAR